MGSYVDSRKVKYQPDKGQVTSHEVEDRGGMEGPMPNQLYLTRKI
jgi:hypothetical protein